mmetsp:Transcript_37417/g.45588  ORF Transcript_37417/g.45588 Transcript_37417/m.45588 type:complete len:160 (-) Transcript_37417:1127-1606(-)
MSPLEPNLNMSKEFADVERLLNRLTGINRFQSVEERGLRMALRVSFLDRALTGLAEAEQRLSSLDESLREAEPSTEILQEAQEARGNALICLMVLKALTADQTNALKNRISVIHESFQRSIYFLLLRGRKSKAPSAKAPVNLSRVLATLVKLSERILHR